MNHTDWTKAAGYYAPSMTIVDDDPPYTYGEAGAGERFLANATPLVAGVAFTTSAPPFESFNDGVLHSALLECAFKKMGFSRLSYVSLAMHGKLRA